jgi:ribosome-associated protein
MTEAKFTPTHDDAINQFSPEEMVAAVADLAADRKALEIIQLDLRGMIGYADYFLICSGRSDRQTRAIHDAIHAGMKEAHGLLPRRVEGLSEARWILMDYLDVVVHVFTPETRDYYRLEQLWGEAPALTIDAGAGAGVGAG